MRESPSASSRFLDNAYTQTGCDAVHEFRMTREGASALLSHHSLAGYSVPVAGRSSTGWLSLDASNCNGP
jgi:hypothetical protein